MTMTIEEIEQACSRSQKLDFSRHPLQVPMLTLRETFYPMGFPCEVRTNSEEILAQARDLWRVFEKCFDTPPISVDVHVTEGGAEECPPTPAYRLLLPQLMAFADSSHFSVVDLARSTTQVVLSQAALRHKKYIEYFFLGASPLGHISDRFTTPVHAACVAFEGRGILLCGDSSAGKSTLAYACARSGWTYITDDASMLLNGGRDRMVTGDCHQVRLRPTAATLFPEIAGHAITPRASGKPSVQIPTAQLPWMTCSPTAHVDFVVFLNRRVEGRRRLAPYSRDVARAFMRQVLYGMPESLARHYETIERVLDAEVYELQYSDLDWAIRRLEQLAGEGINGTIAAD